MVSPDGNEPDWVSAARVEAIVEQAPFHQHFFLTRLDLDVYGPG